MARNVPLATKSGIPPFERIVYWFCSCGGKIYVNDLTSKDKYICKKCKITFDDVTILGRKPSGI